MTDWRPSASLEAARQRAEILRDVRGHFDALGLLEVDTPALSTAAVSDPQIESLEVRSVLQDAPLYLHTSPEFTMKRLLAAGYPDIFSICRVFRDAEAGRLHQPEFTMLEWYRRGFDLAAIVTDTLELLHTVSALPVRRDRVTTLDYADAVRAATGLDAHTASAAALADAAGADADLRRALGEHRDDWLDLLVAERVVAGFDERELTVLRHFPASQAALARTCPADNRVADRFEVYCGRYELANGYVELLDATELERRMRADQAARGVRRRPQRPLDLALLAAMQHGLPPCAGVALGIERLQLACRGGTDIADVIPFRFGR